MKIVVIEDAPSIAKTLKKYIEEYDPSFKVVKILKSVEDSIDYFKSNKMPDLIFSDIELNDGICFEIFDKIQISTPIIFTTSYSEYWQKAFDMNSINYLLKPFSKKQIFSSIEQYQNTKGFYNSEENNAEIQSLLNTIINTTSDYKERFLIRKNNKFSLIDVDEIVYLKSSEKLTHIFDISGVLSYTYQSLSSFERQLNPTIFFRINRQYILNVNHISMVKPYHKGKLKVILADYNEEFIVPQARASEFKKWLKV